MTSDMSTTAREVSKLRESDLYSPVKPSPMTRERKFSMTGGGTPPVKPKKVTPPPTFTGMASYGAVSIILSDNFYLQCQ